MPKLLVVDPLDLEVRQRGRKAEWSSRACFERSFAGVADCDIEYASGRDGELCGKALGADGVILGGSEASAWEDTAFNDHLLDLIAICKNNGVPFLGICFGSQLLGRALGGHVARHPDGIELGAPAIRLTEKGRRHFLFEGIKEGCIWSVETHNDAVLTLPPECELLASTGHTPVQAFSRGDLLVGVQFHPEMSGADLRYLWQAFECSGVVDTIPEDYARIIGSCECERVDQVMVNFAERVKANSGSRAIAP